MPLIKCHECGADVSDQSKSCVHCGVRIKPSIVKWLFIIPAALVAAFLLFGASIPNDVAASNASYRLCRDMLAKGQVSSLSDCDKTTAGSVEIHSEPNPRQRDYNAWNPQSAPDKP